MRKTILLQSILVSCLLIGCGIGDDGTGGPDVTVHVAYFNPDNGCLKHAAGSLGSWQRTSVDSSTSGSGYDASISVDEQGYIHIAYQDGSFEKLHYATNRSGSWQCEVVDNSTCGMLTSMALDSNGVVHICYMDHVNGNLKYATGNAGSWQIEVLYVSSGSVVYQTATAVDSGDAIHILFGDFPGDNIMYAVGEFGSWQVETVDGGAYPALYIDEDDTLHIVYVSGSSLKYAKGGSGSWQEDIVYDSLSNGQDTAIAVDSDGVVHFAYLHRTTAHNLIYATGTPGNWNRETVRSGWNTTYGNTSLAVDGTDRIHLCFFENETRSLEYGLGSFGNWDWDVIEDDLAFHSGDNSIALVYR